MIDFTQKNEAQLWHAINDGVMGGNSQGRMQFNDNSCVFSGEISLENNGGFSSVIKSVEPLAKTVDKITIHVLGDGMTYQLRLITYIDGYRVAYKHHFTTSRAKSKDKPEHFELLLKNFIPSFRGRVIDNAPRLRPEDVQQLGLLVKNNTAAPFSLTLFKLNVGSSTNNS
ncbi:CIA30 family protein [Colwellia sp. E2M01]|uniref:CIA30 family protein n=1 Tax=Colwellia sp. E2M01 TaxID=2841561 RepID=UPI001C0A4D15|nr:CIA30 family protein [Colwellia sp. E2M01]MBU2870391.1 CIA30 family protein [Colwellia sp. E2M01]